MGLPTNVDASDFTDAGTARSRHRLLYCSKKASVLHMQCNSVDGCVDRTSPSRVPHRTLQLHDVLWSAPNACGLPRLHQSLQGWDGWCKLAHIWTARILGYVVILDLSRP